MPTIKNRRATKSQWTLLNPVLAAGEIGFEIDTNKVKIGNGLTVWENLVYIAGGSEFESLIETGRLSEEILKSTYAPGVVTRQLRPNGRTAVALGDSNTYLPGGGTVETWFNQLCVRSRQRINYSGVYATAGANVQEASATHLPAIIALNPTPAACFIALGTNNCNRNGGADFNLETDSAAFLDIIVRLREKGIAPIVTQIIPNGNASAVIQTNIQKWNRRLRKLGDQHGFPVVDTFSPLADAATGAIKATYLFTGDGLGLHLNPVGRRKFADTVIAEIGNLFPSTPLLTAKFSTDPANLIPFGTSWSQFNDTANATTTTVAPIDSDNLAGNWTQISYVGTTTYMRQSSTVTPAVPPGGHLLALSGRFQSTGIEAALAAGSTTAKLLIRAEFRDATTSKGFLVGVYNWPVDCADGTFYIEGVAPAGTTGVRFQVQVEGATAGTPVVVRYAEMTVRDLTNLG